MRGAEKVDALVLGTGLAGLNFALEFAEKRPHARVLVITKSLETTDSATHWAQGGIAAAMQGGEDVASHLEDTLKTGGGITHEATARLVVNEGPERVRDLIRRGVDFTKKENNKDEFDFTREGGHSRRRVLHSADHTGRAIIEALLAEVKKNPRIELRTGTIAVDLVSEHKLLRNRSAVNDTCLGAYLLDIATNTVYPVSARVTHLATGGAGKVYKYTSNPDTAVGDGIAMAHRLGAHVANMEFIQFHPTCLFHPQAKSALLSEALRGEGAYLVNSSGERFMKKYHPMGELAPRDVVALSIDKEIKSRGDESVFLDISHKGADFVRSHFPHNYATCMKFGFDLTKQPVPVVPAAHYTCGGVMSDLDGRTSIQGLYVAGEAAHTGLHGANRLASNSLLEAAVFSHRAALHASQFVSETEGHGYPDLPPWNPGFAKAEEEEVIISHNWDEIRTLMWNYVGIVRSNRRLEYAARRITNLKQEINQCYWERKLSKNLVELRNLVTVADLIVTSAQMRKESRGLHQNIDYPETDDVLFGKDTIL
ncbi:MAG TPA: L-aspartate oxidase [Bdellovibrionota bacterium]|jgi:L-aspartate oxidase